MKVLLLLPQLPYPPRQGAAIRNYHFLRWLAGRYEVHLLAVSAAGEPPIELRELCASIRLVPPPPRRGSDRLRDLIGSPLPDLALRLYSPALERALSNWLDAERFDALHVECLETSLPWLRVCRNLPAHRRPRLTIFDDHNAEYLLQWRAFRNDVGSPRRWPAAGYSLLQAAKLRHYERRLLRAFDRVIAVSRDDAQALRNLEPGLSPTVIPNGVDCEYFVYRPAVGAARAAPCVVFTGTMDYRPNVDAAVWFVRAVLPLVRREVPAATFLVVGANPAPAVRRLSGESGVEVTGAVVDVRPYLAQSRVYALPMRIGGGVRLKALEAMAAGLPLVSTGLGCAGIEAEPGRHYLRADDATAFARRLVDVLTGKVACDQLVAEARRLMEERYDWRRLCPALADVYG